MEIGKQIRKYRTEGKLSQDALAEQVFVTRQTVSNWENDRSYPDVRSLLLLSQVFGVSLDTLIKGDLEQMKEQISEADIGKFKRDSWVYLLFLVAIIVLPVPLMKYLGLLGFGLWLAIFAVALWWAGRIEKFKKSHDIQTYREIMAFMEGKTLEPDKKNQEIGKRPYQTVAYVVSVSAIAFVLAYLMAMLFF